jgi:hypothetical protein
MQSDSWPRGASPSHARKLDKAANALAAANTFDAIAAELIDRKRREGKAERAIIKLEWFMSLARPAIGARPMTEISAPEVLAILRPIEARGCIEPAKKLWGAIEPVFGFAVAPSRVQGDPAGS